MLGQSLHAAPAGRPLGTLAANVALVLEVRDPWVHVLGGDGALGWLERPLNQLCPAAVEVRSTRGDQAVRIKAAERRETVLFDGPAQVLFLQTAEGDWREARSFRVTCPHAAAQRGHLVLPFVLDPWSAGQALAQAREHEGIGACTIAETWHAEAPAEPWLAALYDCDSATGPQHLLALGDDATVRHARAIALTRAQLTCAQAVDLDGDQKAEWLVELSAAGSEVERRDLWVGDGAGQAVTFRTLAYSDESSPAFRVAWGARAGSGLWSVVAAGSKKSCEHFTYRAGALAPADVDAAFCRCAFAALRSGSIPDRCQPARSGPGPAPR